jgi:hypothetical protein
VCQSARGLAQSKTLRVGARLANLAQRLECGAFTAAVARTGRLRTFDSSPPDPKRC